LFWDFSIIGNQPSMSPTTGSTQPGRPWVSRYGTA